MSLPQSVVIDTNLLISSLVLKSDIRERLCGYLESGTIKPLISQKTEEELSRVLSYTKFSLSGEEREYVLNYYRSHSEFREIPKPPPQIDPIIDTIDSSDRPFLELALVGPVDPVGPADALVTGDKRLLCFPERSKCPKFTVPILSLNQFEGVLKKLSFPV